MSQKARYDHLMRGCLCFLRSHYARAFIGVHAGIDEGSIPALDTAERLTQFDPLLFAMKGTRAISMANQGRFDDAAGWAIRATQEPNAHFHIYAIAAAMLELAERLDARNNARWLLDRRPDYTVETFQRNLPHRTSRTGRRPWPRWRAQGFRGVEKNAGAAANLSARAWVLCPVG